MNTAYLFSNLFVCGLIATAFVVMGRSLAYFRRQKETCAKYPLYRLRDKIIWEIISSAQPKPYEEIYERVNSAIARFRGINFRAHTWALYLAIGDLIEAAHKHNNGVMDRDFLERYFGADETQFEKEFIDLFIAAGRHNSVLFMLSMTPLGSKIMFRICLHGALNRFFARHPEYQRKVEAWHACSRVAQMTA